MAKVKITGHASGSGVVTVTAPNTSTDRTITLPDATCTLADNSDVTTKLPLAGGAMTGLLSNTVNVSRAANGIRSNATNLLVENTHASGAAGLRLKGGSGEASIIYGENNSTDKLYLIPRNDTGKQVIIDHIGNVGIGRIPAALLHLQATVPEIRFTYTGNSGYAHIKSNDNSELIFSAGTTDGQERMRIDSTGAVTMPSQPSIAVTGSVGGYTTVNSGSVAPFNTIETQTGGSNYNTSTFRYTAPVAGWYHVTFACLSQSSISQEWLLRKNANTIRRCFEDSDRGWSFSTQVYCAVNDYLDIESNSTNSNNIYMNSGGNTYSWVSYRLLG